MSQPHRVFRCPPSNGWIVISGSVPTFGSESPQLAEKLMEKVDLSRTLVCLLMGEMISHDLHAFIDDVEALIEAPATVIRAQVASELECEELYENAGLILLTGGQTQDWIRTFELPGSCLKVERLLQECGLVFATGSAATALGTWVFIDEEKPIPGLGWLDGAVVLPNIQDPVEIPGVKELISQHEHLYALGFPQGAILALGPKGEVEVWGGTPPIIALGRGWDAW